MKEKWKIIKEPYPEKIIPILEDRIYEYNSAKINQKNGLLFAQTVRNDRDEVIAGIAGWTWAHACEISQFWVSEKRRGNGLGKNLLEAAESEARKKGCLKILIKTYSFQAPDFYEKFGYKIVHVLEDFPPGYTYCTFLKDLK